MIFQENSCNILFLSSQTILLDKIQLKLNVLLLIYCMVAQAEFSQLCDYNIRECSFHLQQKQIINAKPQKICKVFLMNLKERI